MKQLPVVFFMLYSENYTGGPKVLVNLLSGLNRNKFKPIVYTNKRSPMTQELLEMNYDFTIFPLSSQLSQKKNRSVVAYSWNLIKIGWSSLKFNIEIYYKIKNNSVRLLWVRNIKGVLLSGFGAKLSGAKIIWDIGLEKKSQGLMVFLHLIGFMLSNKIVVEAKCVPQAIFKTWMLTLYRKKIIALPSAISKSRVLELYSNQPKQQTLESHVRVLFIGSISDRKNPLLLIKALAKMKLETLNIKVQFVGPIVEPEYKTNLDKEIERHSLRNIIEFCGWQNNIGSYMVNNDILVVSSKNEGVPYTLMEAMHLKMAVIATAVGGIPEIIEDRITGILIQPDNIDNLVNSLNELIENKELRLTIGNNAKAFVTQSRTQKKWVKKYEEVLMQTIDGVS